MNSRTRYPRQLLMAAAAESGSVVDLMRRIGAPLSTTTQRYVLSRLAHYGIDTSHFQFEPLPGRPPRSYPRAALAEAARHSTSIRDVVEHLGYEPADIPYWYIRKRLDHFGIDTSHFTGHGGSGPRLSTEELAAAIAASTSLTAALRSLGMPDTGATRRRVKHCIKNHELDTSHFLGQGHRRGVTSPNRKCSQEILRVSPPGSARTKTSLLRRALDDEGVPRCCADCGTCDIWFGRRITLEIDHINGDRLDNRQENLRYLCPNCHATTSTWCKRRSRGSGSV